MESGFDLSNFSILDLFSMEVETQTEVLTDKLLSLESQLEKSKNSEHLSPILEALMRASHSIKGAARVAQIEIAVKLAHVMEDYFTAGMEDKITLNNTHIDGLLKAVDFLQKLSRIKEQKLNSWLNQKQAEIEELIKAIASFLTSEPLPDIPREEITSSESSSEEIEVISEVIKDEYQPERLSLDDVFPDGDDLDINGLDESEDLQSSLELSSIFLESKEIPPTNQQVKETLSSAIQSVAQFSSESPQDRFVKVSSDNLNRLMGLAGEALVEATSLAPFADSLLHLKKQQLELSKLLEKLQTILHYYSLSPDHEALLKNIVQKERQCREILGDRVSVLEQFSYRSVNLSDRLYREVIASHMRPFSDGVQGFSRMVRDLAKQLKKKVNLEIIGKGTPVDRDILKKLEAPLTHMLRNAIDHGIESPKKRREQGKPEEGTIRLEATHRFGMLSITVADDGQGIDLEKLRQRVIDKQLIKPDMVQQLTESELIEFIFLPGFSTTEEVTEISGRGIGLNIAKTMVEEVGGSLQAISKLGKGLSFHFQLPLTLSVIRTLLVEISGEPYAFPLTRIDRVFMLKTEDIYCVENRQYFTIQGQHIGLVRADQVLDLTVSKFQSDILPVIIVSDQLNRYGLVVDRFLGERNLVIRPLDSRLGKIPDISAAALLEDGSPVLILDVLDLVRSIDKLLSSSYLTQARYDAESSKSQEKKSILVVDDSITVREMERKLLENQGYKVEVAIDGMEGWNAVASVTYDLVITDIDMPRMNGIKLVSQIKKHPQLKSIPIIIVSYKEREEDRVQGLEAGADYYLTKSSFHDDSFINAVVDLIGKA